MDARITNALEVTTPSDCEIVLTRSFNAPRRLVFAAMTQAEHVRRWYGCDAFSLTVCDIDLRVGGAYRFTMRSPDGVDHTLHGVYREVSPPDRLVHTEAYATEGFSSDAALVTSVFSETDGRTTLTVTILHTCRENRDMHLGSGMERGAGEAYDRLATVVQSMAVA